MADEFRFQWRVPVRFKDLDVGEHAHHSHALVYFEEARAAFWQEVAGREGLEGVDYILAECAIRYHARVLWPQELRVGVRVSRLGKRHFVLAYEVRSDEGALLISGTTTQVVYDYEAGASRAMDPEVRARLEAWDGPFGPGGVPAEPER